MKYNRSCCCQQPIEPPSCGCCCQCCQSEPACDPGYEYVCGCNGCGCYCAADRDPFWPPFSHPRWLSLETLYSGCHTCCGCGCECEELRCGGCGCC